MKYKITIIICILLATPSLCQSANHQAPTVDRAMPAFELTRVTNFSKKSVTLDTFKGKWLLLDFWFTGCTNAIRSLPKMSALQKRFKGEMQVLMVGTNGGRYQNIENVYEMLKQKYDLQLATAYDSVLHVKWGIWSMPYIIIVDPQGVVRHITTGNDMTEEKLKRLFAGEIVLLNPATTDPPDYDITKFSSRNDSTLLYRSVLTRWNGEKSFGTSLQSYVQWPTSLRKEGLSLVGFTLDRLYQIAYTGIDNFNVVATEDGLLLYPKPIIETTNKRPFQYDTSFTDRAGIYNYNLSLLPSRSKDIELIKTALQSELNNIFGFTARIEKREFEIWKISSTVDRLKKLATKGEKKEIKMSPINMSVRNVSLGEFYRTLIYQLSTPNRIFLEKPELEFKENIDLELNAVLTDFYDVRRALKDLGFDIVKESMPVSVLVIVD
jgi:hypothetical protein